MTKPGTELFHITAIPNLAAIAGCGSLLAKSQLNIAGAHYADIAYQSVQGIRAMKPVPKGPGGVVHDYVPFYFAPHSPMLWTINGGNVLSCPYRQDDIVHLRTRIVSVLDRNLPFVFYNANAALAYSECYDRIEDLGCIDWSLFFEPPLLDGYCMFWQNRHGIARYVRRMETRMAEFLVHEAYPIGLIDEIGARTQQIAAGVKGIVSSAGWDVAVSVRPNWYY